MATDSELDALAEQVLAAERALNAAIRAAHDAGLRVEARVIILDGPSIDARVALPLPRRSAK